MMKAETQTYELWTYDVWGNTRDGFDVNDRYYQGTITIKVKPTRLNVGTEHEFVLYEPTDRQLNRAIGGRGLEWEGEADYGIYASNRRDGKPVCELVRVK